MEKPKYEIGERIKKCRIECGYTQQRLAKELEVTNSRISNWEQGLNRPDSDILAKLCEVLHISPSFLLGVEYHNKNDLSFKEWALILAYRCHSKKTEKLLIPFWKSTIRNTDTPL